MKLLKLKIWLASINKRTWVYVGAIAGLVVLALVGLFVWMHMCGYTIISWLAKFWPTLVVALAVIIVIVGFVIYLKMKKRS